MSDVVLDLKSEIERLREEQRQAKLVEVAVDESFRKIQQELVEVKANLAVIVAERDALLAEVGSWRMRVPGLKHPPDCCCPRCP